MRLIVLFLLLTYLTTTEAFRYPLPIKYYNFDRSGTRAMQVQKKTEPGPKPAKPQELEIQLKKVGKLRKSILLHLRKMLKITNFIANASLTIQVPEKVYNVILPDLRLNRIM